jgi:hypothetical protein
MTRPLLLMRRVSSSSMGTARLVRQITIMPLKHIHQQCRRGALSFLRILGINSSAVNLAGIHGELVTCPIGP